MIRVVNLTKRYGKMPVLASLSFAVPAGQTLGLWGHNGAGKSTTLKCLLGLVRFEGEVRVGDLNVRRQPREARRLMGYVPQEMPVYDLTVRETAAFFAGLRGVPAPTAAELLEEVGLEGALGKPVAALSGGMRQRLGLALALLGDPPVLLLDEPTANLDERARRELLALLGRFREAGKTMVIASHRADELRALADSVLVLEHGRLRAEVAPGEEADLWLSG